MESIVSRERDTIRERAKSHMTIVAKILLPVTRRKSLRHDGNDSVKPDGREPFSLGGMGLRKVQNIAGSAGGSSLSMIAICSITYAVRILSTLSPSVFRKSRSCPYKIFLACLCAVDVDRCRFLSGVVVFNRVLLCSLSPSRRTLWGI